MTRSSLCLAFAALLPACGGGGGGGAPPSTIFAGLSVSGGLAEIGGNFDAIGGPGGTVALFSRGDLTIDSAVAPSTPAVPAPPTTGTAITSASLTGASYTQASGNLLLPGTVVTPAVATYTLTCSSGDIVVGGLLMAGDGPGAPANLVLNAPAGTVYVTGGITTFNQDVVPDGLPVGSLQITANRIVVTGVLSTRGETAGGNGGSISLSAAGGAAPDVLFVGGRLDSSGGLNTAGSGGTAGDVTIDAAGEIHALPPTYDSFVISAQGGFANGPGTISGGAGGTVTLRGVGRVEAHALVGVKGGDTTSVGTATGGAGGLLSINEGIGPSGPVRISGEIIARGGAAQWRFGGTDMRGGAGGGLRVGSSSGSGVPGAPSSVLIRGPLGASGGSAQRPLSEGTGTGGTGGTITLSDDYATAGNIAIRAELGAGGGGGADAGGAGGVITVATVTGSISVDADVRAWGTLGYPGTGGAGGDVAFSTITGDIGVNADVSVYGGLGGVGGVGGSVSVTLGDPAVATSGIFTLAGSLVADGGVGTNAGGDGGTLTLTLRDSSAGVSSLARLVTLSGSLASANGGFVDVGSVGDAGDGGVLSISAQGLVSVSGTMSVAGGIGAPAAGGAGDGGTLTLASQGNVTVSGGLGASGGVASGPGGNGGSVSVSALGQVVVSGSVAAAGGSSGGGSGSGGDGGSVSVISQGPVTVSGTLQASGGSCTGGPAGDGGTLTVTAQASVTLSGRAFAVGGTGSGSSGGNGGILDVLTINAAISITATGRVEVYGGVGSGGAGAGGNARNDGGPGVTDDPSMLAVRLRAGTGTVTNAGFISASGAPFDGDGGDVLFVGAGLPASGGQTRSAAGAGSPGQFAGL